MFKEKGIDKDARPVMIVNHSSWFGVFLGGKGVSIVTFVTGSGTFVGISCDASLLSEFPSPRVSVI